MIKKVVILAGGLGTRLSEETKLIPNPMVKIGRMPILLHLIKYYSTYGVQNFIICLGYKGNVIKKFFLNYEKKNKNFCVHINKIIQNKLKKDYKSNIILVDTGIDTQTGGRLQKVKKFIDKNENFYFTYGDGLSNVNLNKLLKFHLKHKKMCTVTAVQPNNKFGVLNIAKNHYVNFFNEKPKNDWINGGFFVLRDSVIKLIKNKKTIFERSTLKKITKKKQLVAFKHKGFWQCMDTERDKNYLNEIWLKKSFLEN